MQSPRSLPFLCALSCLFSKLLKVGLGLYNRWGGQGTKPTAC